MALQLFAGLVQIWPWYLTIVAEYKNPFQSSPQNCILSTSDAYGGVHSHSNLFCVDRYLCVVHLLLEPVSSQKICVKVRCKFGGVWTIHCSALERGKGWLMLVVYLAAIAGPQYLRNVNCYVNSNVISYVNNYVNSNVNCYVT